MSVMHARYFALAFLTGLRSAAVRARNRNCDMIALAADIIPAGRACMQHTLYGVRHSQRIPDTIACVRNGVG